MKIRISESATAPMLLDVDLFDRFSVEVTAQWSDDPLAAVGRRVGDHVFVSGAVIRELAGPAVRDPTWCARLDDMIAFAASNGWTDADGHVRAHIEVFQKGIV